MAAGLPGYLRWRLVSTGPNGKEICSDLPHLHRSLYQIQAMQPGNPGSSAMGSFRIPLYPPYTRGYANAKVYYDQIDFFQRVEAYLGYNSRSIGLGQLVYAGIIDDIRKDWGLGGNAYEISGKGDVLLAHLSQPFPGELLSNDVISALVKSYLGMNEMGWADTFNPYTAANYNATNFAGGAAGAWSSTTDDGFTVISNSTGNGAALVSKTGAAANDRWHTQYVEVTGRLKPSTDAGNAGRFGIGLSQANNSVVTNNCFVAFATASYVNGRYVLDVTVQTINGGVPVQQFTWNQCLQQVEDPQGFIAITIGILLTDGSLGTTTPNMSVVVNGRIIANQFPTGCASLGTNTYYPFLYQSVPASGSSTAYMMNLIQFTRFSNDGPSSASVFGAGSIPASTHSLGWGVDPGASFLEAWSRLATRDSLYWRYTPKPYAAGVRTLGTIDMAASPGTDRSQSLIFSRRNGSLLGLSRRANADYLVSSTAATGQSSYDGGGIGFWRDIATAQKYGALSDETLAFTNSDFGTLRRHAYRIVQNKINVGAAGAKIAYVKRSPQTDALRELDRVLIDDPETGVNKLSTLVLGKDFAEGSGHDVLYLDQFAYERA